MSSDSTLVGRIVGEWADRLARGEPVQADAALALYPELADQLRPLLSALGAVSAISHDPMLPRLVGFRVVRELGRGGMGVVYEAEEEALGRRVAVKVLPPHLLGRPEYVARFRQEARAAAGLHHTHIVPVFGFGESGGAHYIVMQFITGAPPEPGTTLLPYRVASLGAKLADALAFAHAHGILHRDVKPGNVLIDAAGEPWLADFGLARVDAADALTDPAGFIGTLRYAAPERFHGVSDARSDVYSLGLTLYELATGRPAFDATDRAALTAQLTDATPPRPRALNPTIPHDLETVLLKAIARDPAHRYPTAAAFADDLRRVADGRPIRARRIGPFGRLWRWGKRHPVIAGLVAAVFLSLALGLAGVYWQWRQAEANFTQAEANATAARDASERESQSREVAERRVYALTIRRAQDALDEGEDATARNLLDTLRPHDDSPDRRGWEWHWLNAALARRVALNIPTNGKDSAFAVAADGRIAVAFTDGTVRVFDPAGKELIRRTASGKVVSRLVWRPDGKALAAAGADGVVRVWEGDATAAAFAWAGLPGSHISLNWRADGKALAVGQKGRADILEVTAKKVERSFPHKPGDGSPNVGWSPDQKTFTTTGYTRVRLWDTTSWEEKPSWDCSAGLGIQAAEWSPDGKYYATGGLLPVVQVFDATGKVVGVYRDHTAALTSVVWSAAPAGHPPRLATADLSGAIRVWDVPTGRTVWQARPEARALVMGLGWVGNDRLFSRGGRRGVLGWNLSGEAALVSRHQQPLVGVVWDGDRLLSMDSGRHLKCVATTNPTGPQSWQSDRKADVFTALHSLPPLGHAVAWHAESHRIATTDADGLVRVLDDRTREVVKLLPSDGKGATAAAFDPTGGQLMVGYFDGKVRVWDVAVGTAQTIPVPLTKLEGVAWTVDGRRIAVCGKEGVRVLSPDGTLGHRLAEREITNAVAFDRTGTRVAAGSPDGRVRVWDAASGELLHTLTSHGASIKGVAWGADGRLATTGTDATVRVWDAALGSELLTLRGLASAGEAVAWSGDGRRLAAGLRDGTVRVWDAGLGAEK